MTFFSTTTWVSQHEKGRPFWILLEQESGSGSGISWTICKSFAPRSRQVTTPVPHNSVFAGRMPFLSPSQQYQSIEGTALIAIMQVNLHWPAPTDKNWRILLEQSFTAHNPLLTSGSALD